MARVSHPRADVRRTSPACVVAVAAVIVAAILWCAATSYAQEASWRRYVEAGCPRNVEAEQAAYQEFLAPDEF